MTDSRTRLLALALQRASFLHAAEKLKLWDIVDDAASLSVLSLRDLEAALGRRLESGRWNPASLLAQAEADALLLERIGARFVCYDESEYPPLLRETAQPPFGLYVRGPMLRPDRAAVSIVGTRLPTGRGLETARRLAREFSRAGVTVVSGLARGIDGAAHRGALDAAAGSGRARSASGGDAGRSAGPAGGFGGAGSARVAGSTCAAGLTCAVLPCGIDAVYPPSNRNLAAAILDSGGLLLSEYPPGTDIQKYRFPERNRIIAGVARACVVVEAPLGSGALITATEALGEGRDLWVAAACLGGSRSGGIDRLASEGAPLIGTAGDMLSDWGLALPERPEARDEPLRAWTPALGAGASGAECPSADEGRRLAESLGAELGLGTRENPAGPAADTRSRPGAGPRSGRLDLRERAWTAEE
ncbi:MAG: DNA-protecting protein DprA [Treponema sp.]|nr:DNA-protecting protein DprA [Treponema sp.]